MDIQPVTTAEDIADVASLAGVIWRDYFPGIITPEQVEYMVDKYQSEEAMTRQIESGELEYYRLVLEDELVGYFALRREADGVFLSKLYIRRECRGKRLARAAVGWVADHAREHGLPRIWLTTNKHNDLAVAVYERLGFVTIESVCTDIGSGFVMDDFIMELRV